MRGGFGGVVCVCWFFVVGLFAVVALFVVVFDLVLWLLCLCCWLMLCCGVSFVFLWFCCFGVVLCVSFVSYSVIVSWFVPVCFVVF